MNTTTFQHAAVPTPKQKRSEKHLQLLLKAARELLETHSFDELSIQKVVKRVGCSVGTFYARFEDKEALLDSLDELYARELVAEFEAAAQEWTTVALALPELVESAATFLVEFHRHRRGVARALILHARMHPRGSFGERTRRMISFTPGIVRVFLQHRDSITHEEPKKAVRFGVVQALTTVREFVLFPEGPASTHPMNDEDVAKEVARSWYLYLTGDSS